MLKVETGGKIAEFTLERYVATVVAGESSVFQSSEALKAMAVAARTYAVRMRGRHSSEGFDFCETTHCQRLELGASNSRVEEAVRETEGELLWYRGKPAFTPYCRDCGGRSEADTSASYLLSHPDIYCARAGISDWQWRGDPAAIAEALQKAGLHGPRKLERVTVVERTASGRARTLLLAGGGESVRISAGSFHFAVGRALGWNTIRSDRYEVFVTTFKGTGAGHGVGLCQRGADEMGREGRSYREILAYYYPGTAVGLTGTGLSWQHLSGERVTLWTVRPTQDTVVLAEAESELRKLQTRTGWTVPRDVQIRVYPDLDSFRNATGEGGWIAGYTQAHRIYLQPVQTLQSRGVLHSTVIHELVHVITGARTDLPLWFQEGLANYLAAYHPGSGDVAALVRRYGETTVLGWATRGLPRDVTNASASNPAMKSK
jgi:stage II sporulation protein D